MNKVIRLIFLASSLFVFSCAVADEKITKIVLSGGNAKDKSLAEYLGEELKDLGEIKIELPDPWQNIANVQKDLPLDDSDSLRFASTIGLAKRLLS